MGETQNQPFQLSFNPSLKVDFQDSHVTSDDGLLLVPELDERLGLSALIAENIRDERLGKNTQLPLPDLLRQSIQTAGGTGIKNRFPMPRTGERGVQRRRFRVQKGDSD